MIFNRPLIIESPLPANATRVQVRVFATWRDMPKLEAFRRRQIVGWRLSQANEDFLFQPEYGDSLDIEGTRFVALVESAGWGSRIRGHVIAAPLTKIVMSMFMLVVVVATLAALREQSEPAAKVLSMGAIMLGGALLMVRYSLRSTSRFVAVRLRQCLETAESRAAA